MARHTDELLTVSLKELRPNPQNPRGEVTADDVIELVASVKAQGILQPLLILPDGTVVAGHRRLLAAGFRCVGVDVVASPLYRGELVLQDIRTLDGTRWRGFIDVLVASPPLSGVCTASDAMDPQARRGARPVAGAGVPPAARRDTTAAVRDGERARGAPLAGAGHARPGAVLFLGRLRAAATAGDAAQGVVFVQSGRSPGKDTVEPGDGAGRAVPAGAGMSPTRNSAGRTALYRARQTMREHMGERE